MRSRSLQAAAAAIMLLAPRAGAVGGSITDGAVTLTYPPQHWSGGGLASFAGTRVAPADDVVYASGWWYRLNNVDTREHPLPAPSSESYGAGQAALSYPNVDGKEFDVVEFLTITDNEGPSGTYSSSLCVTNQHQGTLSLSLFHYLDGDVDATYGGDVGWPVRPDLLTFSENDTLVYRGPNAAAWLARPVTAADSVFGRLNDNVADDFDDSGLPANQPDDLAAGYQWNLTIPEGGSACWAAQVVVSSRPLRLLVKGDLNGELNYAPDLLMQKPATGELISWNMRRAQSFQTWFWAAQPPQRDVVGVDDFRGAYGNQLLTRDRVTGVAYLDGQQLQTAVLPLNWKAAATADVDGDGRADILWRNTTSQKLVIWTMNGTQKTGAWIPTPDQAADANWEVVGLADLNGDRTPDFLWYNVTSGKLVIWFMNASLVRTGATFTTPSNAGGSGWRPVAVGDFGAGPGGLRSTQDIVWRNSTSGRLVVWHMDFAGTRTSGEFTSPDAPPAPATDWQVVGPR